uniref:tRNA-uridine aminocarboxypropyltransferase 1 n=1 Tax=Clastoptera arizonana TaxID=38151 RepID=A0A1B6CI90_9HEMI
MEEMKRKIQMAPMFVSLNDSNPFDGLKISEKWKKLEEINNRSTCKNCKKSRKYFCYTCYKPVPDLEKFVPKVKLPLKIDIIKHCRERSGKSTATHAAVLAPDDVTIYTYPNIPEYGKDEKVVLIYPGKNAKSIFETVEIFKKKLSQTETEDKVVIENHGITRAVFIDSTWNQSHGIYKDPKLQALPCVVLQSRISQFWRYQSGSPRWYLSTIEAIHQFLIDLVYTNYFKCCEDLNLETQKSDSGNFNLETHNINSETNLDNLLFFFRFMYEKIHTLYDPDSLLAYKRPLY